MLAGHSKTTPRKNRMERLLKMSIVLTENPFEYLCTHSIYVGDYDLAIKMMPLAAIWIQKKDIILSSSQV